MEIATRIVSITLPDNTIHTDYAYTINLDRDEMLELQGDLESRNSDYHILNPATQQLVDILNIEGIR
jgi:hypothetical protein